MKANGMCAGFSKKKREKVLTKTPLGAYRETCRPVYGSASCLIDLWKRTTSIETIKTTAAYEDAYNFFNDLRPTKASDSMSDMFWLLRSLSNRKRNVKRKPGVCRRNRVLTVRSKTTDLETPWRVVRECYYLVNV